MQERMRKRQLYHIRAIIREPWMTPELIKSPKKRMQLWRKALGKDRLSESF